MAFALRTVARGDAAAIHSLIRAGEVHDAIPIVTSLREVEEYFDQPHFDPALDARLAMASDGTPIGWGRVSHIPSGERLERAHVLGTVHPAQRRQGVGSAILSWQVERAREMLLAYTHDLPRYIRTMEYESVTDAIRLYERHGFSPVRWFEDLLRSLDDIPPVDPPRGVEVLSWAHGRDLEVLDVRNEAFADHWGAVPDNPDTWHHWLQETAVRLDLSVVAVAGSRVVGYAINEHYPADEEVSGRREGWIGSLGVVRDWRGRGVASALIARSLELFRGAGLTHAMIGVDSDNPSGAALLYRRLGFVPQRRSVTHQIEVKVRAGTAGSPR